MPLASAFVSDTSVVEDDASTAAFTVTLSSPAPAGGASVQFSTANETATSPGDYTAIAATTITFAPGETTRTVHVPVNGDAIGEATETLLLNLSAPVGIVLGDSQGRATIVDDEGLPVVSVGDTAVVEGAGGTVMAWFTVSLSLAPSRRSRSA